MAPMRSSRVLCLLFAAGCAGVVPDPAAARAGELRVVELTDEQLEQRRRDEQAAVDRVVRGDYDGAEQRAEAALATDPRAARARAVLGMVHLQRALRSDPPDWADLRLGETELELARQLAPEDALVGYIRASFLAGTGHLSAAASAAEDALAAAREAPLAERAALLGVAGAYRYELGEERAARPHLEAYVGLRPDDAAAQFRLGACLLRIAQVPQGIREKALQGAQLDAESAAKAFARCSELRPEDEDAALSVATALLRAAELAEERGDQLRRDAHRVAAAEHLAALADRFPSSAEVRFRVGVLAELQAQPDIARAAYDAALERDAGHVATIMNLAALHAAAGDVSAARGLLERLLALDQERRVLQRDERRRIERWIAEPPAAARDASARGQMPGI